ncbi:hypothetical protein CEXT_89871 [Caerostris extrusa]|uniref:C2H2-type domain-containing protein n=1 Tax=Caerostris extrusa TaxID=172846 RepID=A0AAV4QWB2_CAEEX|nr:hypothetical protein CEXT_89871 [Caerostris extrusa]
MTRSVKASEELYVWIGVDLISKLEFPFLTPMNIKGNQAYHLPEHTSSLRNDVAFEFRLSQEPTRSLAPSSANMWLNPSSNYFTSSSGHVCSYCGKVYSRKYGLKIHVRTHTGYKPLKCKYCFRPFSDPSNLNKHVRLHSNLMLLIVVQSAQRFCEKKRFATTYQI